jgi:hypothetical protein
VTSAYPPIAGVSLAQYAAVRAALAEPFGQAEALADAGVEPRHWPRAELGWKTLLSADAAALAAYRVEIARAEDAWARPVTPIDASLEGWLAFAAATQGPSGAVLLERLGLGPNDLSRLSRAWARRLEGDAELARRAAEISRRGAGPIPDIVVGERTRAMAVPEVEAPIEELPMSLHRYALMQVDETRDPAIDAAFQSRFAVDPALARDFRALVANERTRREVSEAAPPAPAHVEPPRHADATQDVSAALLDEPELPFRSGDARPALAALHRAVAEEARGADAGGTQDVSSLLLDEPSPGVRGAPAVTGADGTQDVSAALIEDEPLPFAGAVRPPVSAILEESMDAGGTQDVSAALLDEPALPFDSTFDGADSVRGMTLAQYASLVVELELYAARRDQVLARYRIAPDAYAGVAGAWEARFRRHPDLRAAFEQAREAYRRWVLASR